MVISTSALTEVIPFFPAVFSLKPVYACILTFQILVSDSLQRNSSLKTWLQSQDWVCPLSSLFCQTVKKKIAVSQHLKRKISNIVYRKFGIRMQSRLFNTTVLCDKDQNITCITLCTHC